MPRRTGARLFAGHELRALRQQMQTSMPGEQRSLLDEVPPHY